MPFGRLGQFGLWLSLRRRAGNRQTITPLPAFNDPPLILFTGQGSREAAAQVTAAAQSVAPKLCILELDEPQRRAANTDLPAMQQLLSQARPFTLLILGTELPAALIVAASDLDIPMVLGDLHLERRPRWFDVEGARKRNLLSRMDKIFVTDRASLSVIRQMGITQKKADITGSISETHEPLPCNEAERTNLAALINGRHTWFAAYIPVQEEKAVLEAHLAALRQTHLALLLLIPAEPNRADILAKQFEAHDLIVASRSRDEEPTQEVQVMIADSPAELGLWYRLAPVTFMGGTLIGDDAKTRHPFEPAALGSAVVHGPKTSRFATEWQQLDRTGACRQVDSAAGLAAAIAELSQPDLAADLAGKAWEISTSGAGVAMQIVSEVLSHSGQVRV